MFNNTAFAGAGQPPPPILVGLSDAIDIGGAYVCPPYGRVFYVRGNSSGVVPNLDDQYTANLPGGQPCYPTVKSILDAGLCKASRGDVIHVLPGHVESIAAADAWAFVAGLRIVGHGHGNTRPTFTFTVAAATLLLDVAGLIFSNCRFVCDGTAATTVTKPFALTGEGSGFAWCEFHLGTSNTQKCATLMSIAARNCFLVGNVGYADTQATSIANIILLGDADTLGAAGLVCLGNRFKAALAAATTGIIANTASTGASDLMLIKDNYFHQWKSDSSACISFAANMVTTGLIKDNVFRVMNNASVQGVVYSGTGVDVTLDNNKIANTVNETAIQNQGTVSTS